MASNLAIDHDVHRHVTLSRIERFADWIEIDMAPLPFGAPCIIIIIIIVIHYQNTYSDGLYASSSERIIDKVIYSSCLYVQIKIHFTNRNKETTQEKSCQAENIEDGHLMKRNNHHSTAATRISDSEFLGNDCRCLWTLSYCYWWSLLIIIMVCLSHSMRTIVVFVYL